MPHLNELHEKLAAVGLTVIGITSEGEGPTQKWIADNGAKYGYAYDKGSAFSRACGVTGIPSSVLVDATGKVVYVGSPGEITEEMAREAAKGALKTPLYELPKEFAKVSALIGKDDLAGAIKEAQALATKPNLADTANAVALGLKSMVAGAVAQADDLGTRGDWLGAQRSYERVIKSAKGMEEEVAAKGKLEELKANEAAMKEIKLQKSLEKILAMPSTKAKDKEAMLAALTSFATKNDGSFAAGVAKAKASALRKP